ncbi:MAG TPA: hypothetical protein VHC95_12435 [Opitutales bacterium]|nr:hypothetical protein [Opitutales bacterium]
MKPSFNPSDFEERLEGWLASQPVTPAPDFVARTLARIRAEASLVTAARAGDDAALDTLIDRWLGEEPIEAGIEPELMVASTRQAATREEQIENRPKASPGRTILPFPAWARSALALAAAACVAILGYLNLSGPVANLPLAASHNIASHNASPASDPSNDSYLPAHYAWNSDPNYISSLSSSLKDLSPVANSDSLDALTSELGDNTVN